MNPWASLLGVFIGVMLLPWFYGFYERYADWAKDIASRRFK